MDSLFTIKQTSLLIIILLFTSSRFVTKVESLGINYGQVANNLPTPTQVISLLKSIKITKVRIYDTNPNVLSAFANSGVELIVMVPNDMVATLTDPRQAMQWVATRVAAFVPATRITGLAVGNEVYSTDDTTLMSNLVPAMVNVHAALLQLGLSSIHVSTAESLAVLSTSFPPSAGAFKPELAPLLTQLVQFLKSTGAPFWVNAYPYFAYKANPNMVPLDYVMFNRNVGMSDPSTNLHYDNMLYAQVDAVTFAMAKLGSGFGAIEVRVAETGWPSKGDQNEFGATIENAREYNRNLILRQVAGEGTPLRPNNRLEVYVFALFNENMKPGPTSERNYGLYQPDGTMVYNVGLNGASGSTVAVALSSSDAPEIGRIHSSWLSCFFILFCTFHCLLMFSGL